MKLEDMTWLEVGETIDDGVTTVVVGTGSVEQHGPALPMSVDTLRAGALVERIADDLGCFAGPTVRPGISDHHLAFPGTVSLSPETFADVIADYCRSFEHHGFEHVAFVNTHGGNGETLARITRELDAEHDMHVFKAGSREEFLEVRYGAMEKHGVDAESAGAHAGAAETSFVLESDRELVRSDRFERGFVGEVDGETLIEDGLGAVTANGVIGDQTQSSRRAGRTLIDDCVSYYVDAIAAERADRRE